MTNKEAIGYLRRADTTVGKEVKTRTAEALEMAIKALEQESCEDAISRRAIIDMTGLSEWFDSSDSYNEFVIALRELPPVNPQPKQDCSDAISRAEVLDLCDSKDAEYKVKHFKEDVECLPTVYPKSKTGHWIAQDIHNCHTDFKCSECGYIHNFMHIFGEPTADYTYCPNCGAKMFEPQESDK